MTTLINTVQELINALPLNSRLSGPCPFCLDGKETVHNDSIFHGDDRFYLFPDHNGWGCRVCRQKGDGPTGKGWYSHADVARVLDAELSSSFKLTYNASQSFSESNPLQYQTHAQAAENHKNVIRDYWYQFGWSDSTINRFQLGFGTIETWKSAGHLIPMDVTLTTTGEKIPGYYTALRGGGHKIKQRGSSKNYVWLIQGDKYSDSCVITEGEKDLITAYQLGYRNILCTFSSYWNDTFGRFVAGKYRNVLVFRDYDDAGSRWLDTVLKSLLSLGVTVKAVDWAKIDDATPGEDLTDYYAKTKKPKQCRETLEGAAEVTETHVEHAATVNNEKQVPLETIRGDGPDSLQFEIDSFLRNYRYKRGAGNALLLSVGPGAGKTHTLYKAAEKKAKYYRHVRQREYERLLAGIDELEEEFNSATNEEKDELEKFIEKQRKLLDRFTFNSIAWYAPYRNGIDELLNMGADPELWFDFKARSDDNCESYDIVDKLGLNNHAIGKFCELSCPHAEQCKAAGYQSQHDKMKFYPIVFYRHEHLVPGVPSPIQMTVIDESIVHAIESPAMFDSKDLDPFSVGWEYDIEDDLKVDAIQFLVQALRSASTFNKGEEKSLPGKQAINPKYIIHGNEVFSLLDKFYSSHGRDLAEIMMLDKDILNAYQPTYLSGDISKIKNRCIPFIVEALQRELGVYHYNRKANRPSTINIVSGRFEVYSPPKVKIPARIPVIVADATPLLELYKAMFNREIRVYKPLFYKEDTEIIIVRGSDWTRSYIDTQLSGHMANFAKVQETIDSAKTSNMDKVPQILDGYLSSSIFRDIVSLLDYLKDKHKSLLMVTHKNLREFVESILEGVSSTTDKKDGAEVAWGHYGALRGTNKYKDFEALCLIGAFRIPYDVVWRRAQLWAYGLGIMESIPQDLVKKDQDYNLTGDGVSMGSYLTFSHWLGDQLVNHIERGEMIQCAHRIRPHSSKTKKTIYIFATRPATELATQVLDKSKLLRSIRDTTYTQLLTYLKSHYEDTNKLPTYKETRKKFRVSNTTVAEARKEVLNAG